MTCAENSTLTDQVKLRIKHTFIDFACLEEDGGAPLRRQRSDPLFAFVAQEPCVTPTTCDDCLTIASANDDNTPCTEDGLTPASPGINDDCDEDSIPEKRFSFAGFMVDEPVIFDEPGFDSPDIFDAKRSFSFAAYDMGADQDVPEVVNVDQPGFDSPYVTGMPTIESTCFVNGYPQQAGPADWHPRAVVWPEICEMSSFLSTRHHQLIPSGYRTSTMHPGDASSRVPLVPAPPLSCHVPVFPPPASPGAVTLKNYYAVQSEGVTGCHPGDRQFEREASTLSTLAVPAPPPPPPPPLLLDTSNSMFGTPFGALVDAAPMTVMVRNLQEDLAQPALVEKFMAAGYAGLFDFVYMPMNFRGQGNFGYAFVNFVSNDIALRFMNDMHGPENGDCDIADPLRWHIAWSTCQGLSANVERYRNSPLMHELVPKECKPALYDETGRQVAFPQPTKNIPKPRVHWPGPKDATKGSVTVEHDSQLETRSRDGAHSHGVAESRRPGRSKNHQRQQQQQQQQVPRNCRR